MVADEPEILHPREQSRDLRVICDADALGDLAVARFGVRGDVKQSARSPRRTPQLRRGFFTHHHSARASPPWATMITPPRVPK
jgi:hypothetical protein